jgi:UDP-N-acetylmuramoyl-L-alanyl-D-glutamate--2,6-diaminopimelate ligase
MTLRLMPEQSLGKSVGEVVSSIEWMSSGDVPLGPVTCDPLQVVPGDIYVAIDEPHHDGHLAAAEAVERGARAVVAERLLPVFGVAQFVVGNTRQAFGELCQALVGNPSHELTSIAVTGSYGKTSIAMLIDSIFRTAGRTSSYQTNRFTQLSGVGGRHLPPYTAPAIAEFLAESVATECQHAVVELGEAALARQAAAAVMFDVVCVTNLPADNGPRGRSRQAIRDTLASSLDLLSDRGIAIFNANDPAAVRVLSDSAHPALTFGVDCEAEVVGTPLEQHTGGQEFLLTVGDDTAVVETAIPGRAHLENCLAAAAVARVYGISLADIARGLERLTVVPGVMQKLDAGLGVATFVDRGDSPVAKGLALSTARDVAQGKVIAVVSQGCPVTEKLADHTVATHGLVPEREIKATIDGWVRELGLKKSPRLRPLVERLTGVALALDMATEGDVIVVSGVGGSVPSADPAKASLDEEVMIKTLLYNFAQRKVA